MENIDPSVYERADEGLLRLIDRAKIGALSKEEYAVYEASLKRLADEMDMDQHGYERGLKQGREEGIGIGREEGIGIGREEGIGIGRLSTIKLLIESGMSISEIASRLHMTEEEIEELQLED